MTRYGYNKKLSTGTVASVGTIGVILPPSIVMIIYGIMTEQSIGKLFLAGIFPALLISFFFIVIIYGLCKIDPTLAPRSTESFTVKEKIQAIPEFFVVAVIFFIVMGGLMAGLFTPTEAGTIGTVAVLILAVARKGLTIVGFFRSLDESQEVCRVLYLIACSAILGTFLQYRVPQIAETGLPTFRFPNIVMIIVFLFYLLEGSFIDDMAL